MVNTSNTVLSLVSPVMEADTGDYECWARAESATAQQVKRILKVLVEPRRGSCQPGQYECGGGAHPRQYCIATRYIVMIVMMMMMIVMMI